MNCSQKNIFLHFFIFIIQKSNQYGNIGYCIFYENFSLVKWKKIYTEKYLQFTYIQNAIKSSTRNNLIYDKKILAIQIHLF